MSEVMERPTWAREKLVRVPAWKMAMIIYQVRGGDFAWSVRNSYTVTDAFEVYFGPYRVIFVHRPELIESLLVKNHKSYHKDGGFQGLRRFLGDGLLTSEGNFHLRQRRMIQPAFHRKRVDTYAECMVRLARACAAGWRDGQTLDLHAEMMKVTLQIIAKTMFNAEVADEAMKVAHALDVVFSVQERYAIPWVGKVFDALPIKSTKQMKQCLADLDRIIYGFIAEHRAAGEDTGDLLSMLLQVKYEDDGSGMPDALLRDECLTLFLAGHETTAVALSWTWYLLSEHPAVEAKMHEEIDRVLGGRNATAEDWEKLTYTRWVFTESMRLYPPAFGFGRQATEDTELGPYKVKKGDTVIVSQYITHRQPEWFPEPEKFDPERWGRPEAAGLPKFAYFPFGGGVRKCVGESFAWMEGILLLVTFAQEWRGKLVAGHVPGADPKVTLRPRNGMPMVMTKRGS